MLGPRGGPGAAPTGVGWDRGLVAPGRQQRGWHLRDMLEHSAGLGVVMQSGVKLINHFSFWYHGICPY